MENVSIILAATAFAATLLLIIYLFAANVKRVKKQKKTSKNLLQQVGMKEITNNLQLDINSAYRLEELTNSSNALEDMTSNLNK